MTVWVVEQECDDSFYGYNLKLIFTTKELAENYIKAQKSYEQDRLEASEIEVLDKLPEE